MTEARLEGGVPQTAGWFVLNARDAPWVRNEMRTMARFGGQGEGHFDDLGIGLYWLEPGQPMSMYHYERGQEDFLVLSGEALAIVEGEERPLKAWDLLHCPSGTPHTIVGAGDEPALVLAVGARLEKGSARYPVHPAAVRHGAGVEQEGAEPYARFSDPEPTDPPDAF
jgi:uncharacterized cupin superfamily protein